MAGAIDFYFDFSSPYGYLAAEMIEEIGQRCGRPVNWHPILLGVVFGIWGLALALPLMAIAKVMIDHFKAEGAVPQAAAA